MSDYTPDRWVVLEFTHKGETTRKVLGGWIGGYARADSWRLNSGITEVKDEGDFFLFSGSSGSVYKCWKQSEGMTSLSAGIYDSFLKQVQESAGEYTLEMITPFRIDNAEST
jgi:hypothetical protein